MRACSDYAHSIVEEMYKHSYTVGDTKHSIGINGEIPKRTIGYFADKAGVPASEGTASDVNHLLAKREGLMSMLKRIHMQDENPCKEWTLPIPVHEFCKESTKPKPCATTKEKPMSNTQTDRTINSLVAVLRANHAKLEEKMAKAKETSAKRAISVMKAQEAVDKAEAALQKAHDKRSAEHAKVKKAKEVESRISDEQGDIVHTLLKFGRTL